MNQTLNNILEKLTIKIFLSHTLYLIFIVSSCFFTYCLSFNKSIDNNILIIFLLIFTVKIHGLSKNIYAQFLES